MTQDTKTEVLYNASCPVCRAEIDHYARIAERDDLPIAFTDLNDDHGLSNWTVSADQAARRLHVRKSGETLDGIPAFIALWQELPKYQRLARVVSLPIIYRLAVWTYDLILAPLLYRWHLRRVRRNCAA